jgi:two-component system, chemotaxis family, protein-glutamate methylesterase/glutaminase
MKTGVLVVDDSPLIRAVLREVFERTSDLSVVGEACDGEDAIAKVVELRPDLVTMDVSMPKMGGLAATKAIMAIRPTPILMVARDGGDARGLALAALGHGALGVFPKPARGFDEAIAQSLGDVIRNLVRESRLREERMSHGPKIRVLIVDDSPVVRKFLRSALEDVGDLEVVGEAGDGLGALRMASRLRPDVVTLDLIMPMMGGEESARAIVRTVDSGILLFTQESVGAARLQAKLGGAVECLAKPSDGFDEPTIAKVVQAVRRLATRNQGVSAVQPSVRRMPGPDAAKVSVVGIVGSTGAPRALHEIVSALPRDFPLPVVLVQHTERGFAGPLAEWLASVGTLPVALGSPGLVLGPGQIVVAPDDLHLEVGTGGIVELRAGDPVDGFRPSGTVLLSSLARTYGAHAMGVVLSGMGMDGADGLGAIDAAGGCTVVEDPDTAAVSGMPSRALSRAHGAWVEPRARLARLLMDVAHASVRKDPEERRDGGIKGR